jgi:hypothetical protein
MTLPSNHGFWISLTAVLLLDAAASVFYAPTFRRTPTSDQPNRKARNPIGNRERYSSMIS